MLIASACSTAKADGKLLLFDTNLCKPRWRNSRDTMEKRLLGLSVAIIAKSSDNEVDFRLGISAKEGLMHIVDTFWINLMFVAEVRKAAASRA